MPNYSQFNTDRTYPGLWTITFNNPPINMFVPTTIVELGALMTDLEADRSVKVVVFQSANPDFFIAHLDVAKAAERPDVLGLWRDFVLRLSSTPVVSIAKIRGRTRGIGNEFVLACDMRFASRQSALFGQPEVGVGLIPGGGALEWLPRLVGRSRALEIILSADDFDADIAERYGWVNRTLDDAALDAFVDTLVRRLASFDRETLGVAKAQVNRFGMPTATELQSSNDMIFPLLALPDAQARRPKLRGIGYGVPSDFELNFGRYLPAFGRADGDETDMLQPVPGGFQAVDRDSVLTEELEEERRVRRRVPNDQLRFVRVIREYLLTASGRDGKANAPFTIVGRTDEANFTDAAIEVLHHDNRANPAFQYAAAHGTSSTDYNALKKLPRLDASYGREI